MVIDIDLVDITNIDREEVIDIDLVDITNIDLGVVIDIGFDFDFDIDSDMEVIGIDWVLTMGDSLS